MAEHTTLSSLFTAIANAIRAKKGTSATIVADDFPDEIASITTGTDVSSTTAIASDVLNPKVFFTSDGTQTTGTMTDNGAVSGSVAVGGTYTVPVGYHNGSGTVTGPTLSGTAAVANVLSGKTFYSTSGTKQTGTMTNRGAVSTTVGLNTSYTIPSGYHNGSGKVYNKWQYISSSTSTRATRSVYSCWMQPGSLYCNTVSIPSGFTPQYLVFYCQDTSSNGNHGGRIDFVNSIVYHSVNGANGQWSLSTSNWKNGSTLYLPANNQSTVIYYLLVGYYS